MQLFELVDILDHLAVQQMKWNALRTHAAALAAVSTTSCHMEGTD